MDLLTNINKQLEDMEKELGKESVEQARSNIMYLKIKVDFYEGENSEIIQSLWSEYLQHKSLVFRLIMRADDKGIGYKWKYRRALNLNDKLTQELLNTLNH